MIELLLSIFTALLLALGFIALAPLAARITQAFPPQAPRLFPLPQRVLLKVPPRRFHRPPNHR